MPREANVWTETFLVRSYETDARGLASIQTLCNYFQEAAGNHASTYGVSIEALIERDLTWVLSRLQVQIDAYPQRGETVRVETWPVGVEGLLAYRDFLFFSAGAGAQMEHLIGRGASAWLVVEVARKRPVRIPPFITEIVLPERPRALPGAFERLQPPASPSHTCRFRVRYSDLDVNQHVNNVHYAEWAVESVPEAVLSGYRLCEMALQFRAETTLGDTVLAEAAEAADGAARVFAHRLAREADGRDVALARTAWVRDT